jgi:hypothetical protein
MSLIVKFIAGILILAVSFWVTLQFLGGPTAVAQLPNIAGADWCVGINRVTIKQSGKELVFINENRSSSRGHFENADAVVADDWGGIRGTISADRTILTWANNAIWQRKQQCESK